jgi:hypothetical protein
MNLRLLKASALSVLLAFSALAQKPEVTSLLGRTLTSLPDTDGAIHAAEQKLAADP